MHPGLRANASLPHVLLVGIGIGPTYIFERIRLYSLWKIKSQLVFHYFVGNEGMEGWRNHSHDGV